MSLLLTYCVSSLCWNPFFWWMHPPLHSFVCILTGVCRAGLGVGKPTEAFLGDAQRGSQWSWPAEDVVDPSELERSDGWGWGSACLKENDVDKALMCFVGVLVSDSFRCPFIKLVLLCFESEMWFSCSFTCGVQLFSVGQPMKSTATAIR